MGLKGGGVIIGAGYDREASLLQSQAQSSGSREQVNGPWTPLRRKPLVYRAIIIGVWNSRLTWKNDSLTPERRNHCPSGAHDGRGVQG